jgi:hypothetical protein
LASLAETNANASADIGSNAVTTAMGSTWLQALNSALDKLLGDNTLDASKLTQLAESYYRILSEADGVVNITTNTDVKSGTSNDPLASDYTNIGATVGATLKSLDLVNDFVGLSAKTAVDTVDEINTVAKAAENVMLKAKGATSAAVGGPAIYSTDSEWIAGLTALGITGVNTSNIAAIKNAIDLSTDNATGDGAAVDTVAEIQQLVSLARVQAFTDDTGLLTGSPPKTAATPILADWVALGVKAKTALIDATTTQELTAVGVNAGYVNFTALNSALDRWDTGTNLDTTAHAKTTMQAIADSYARVLGEADNDRSVDVNVNSPGDDPIKADYENILGGSAKLTTLVNGADSKWLDLLNDAIGGLSSSAVATASQVENLIKVSTNVMNQAVGTGWSYTTNSEWVSALSSLGVSGLTGMVPANLNKVSANIASSNNTDIDSWAELQSIVSVIRINDYAASSLNPVPDFTDFQAFFSYGNTARTDIQNTTTYVNAFKNAVSYQPSHTYSNLELTNMVNGYAAILAEANGATADQQTYDPLGSDYTAVGVGLNDISITTMLGVAETASLLTDVIAGKNQTDVDSVTELNNLAKIITKIYELQNKVATNGGTNGIASSEYTSIYGGALQVSELKALGLDTANLENGNYSTTVLTKRLYDVYDHITAIDHNTSTSRATLDSLQELQTLINNTSVITA